MIMTTHDPGLMELGDAVYEMVDGSVFSSEVSGEPAEERGEDGS